jgi:hypothetical protein
MVAKLRYVTEHYLEIKYGLPPETRDDNMAKMAGWLLQNHRAVSDEPCVTACYRMQSSRDTLRPPCHRVNVEP